MWPAALNLGTCRHGQGGLPIWDVLDPQTADSRVKGGAKRVWRGHNIGFVTYHLSISKGFVPVWAEIALRGFSRGNTRVCKSCGLPGAAGNGARGCGLRAYSSISLLHPQGFSVQEVHLLFFCICVGSKFPPLRNWILQTTTKQTGHIHALHALGGVGKQSKLKKTLLSESCLAGSHADWGLAQPSAVWSKDIYIKLLCESKGEDKGEPCGHEELTE